MYDTLPTKPPLDGILSGTEKAEIVLELAGGGGVGRGGVDGGGGGGEDAVFLTSTFNAPTANHSSSKS